MCSVPLLHTVLGAPGITRLMQALGKPAVAFDRGARLLSAGEPAPAFFVLVEVGVEPVRRAIRP